MATLGTSVSKGVGIPEMLKKISDSLKDPNVRADNRAKVLTAAQTVPPLLDNPIAIKTLLRMVLLHSHTASWLASWLPGAKTEPPSATDQGVDLAAEGGSNLARERGRQYTLQDDLRRAEAQLKDMPKNDKQRRAAQEKKIAGLREELRGPSFRS